MSKEERFYRVMHAVEDELLEEAQMPVKKKGAKGETVLRWIVAVAACLCLVTVLALLGLLMTSVFAAYQPSKVQQEITVSDAPGLGITGIEEGRLIYID